MPELFPVCELWEEIAGKENLFFPQEAHGILDGDCLKKASPGESQNRTPDFPAALLYHAVHCKLAHDEAV